MQTEQQASPEKASGLRMGTLYWRLSSFYFLFFALLGGMLPYWSVFLDSQGFTAQEIGELMAIGAVMRIAAPNLWGWLADKTGQHVRIIGWSTGAAACAFLLIFVDQSYYWYAFVMALFYFFWNAALPIYEANTFACLAGQTQRYSYIRLWGSVGFIVAVVLMGVGVEQWGIRYLPYGLLALFAGLWVAALFTPKGEVISEEANTEGVKATLLKRPVLLMFAVVFLIQASHGPYYTFFTLYLERMDYSQSLIGGLWALGVVAEVVLFIYIPRMMGSYRVESLLFLAALLTALRWMLTGSWLLSPWLLVFSQCLHAASFGLCHSAAITLVNQYFQGPHKSQGQAVYSAIGFGAGNALGTYLAGVWWDSQGGEIVFTFAAITAFIAAMLALFLTRSPHQ